MNLFRALHLRLAFSMAMVLAMFGVPGAQAAAPIQWLDTAGDQSPDASVQITQFLARELWIDAGDSVKWTVKSGEFHTVSLVPPGVTPPDLIATTAPPCSPAPPCFNPAAVSPAGGNTFDNTAFVNSGLLNQGNTFSVTFSTPGTYSFFCLIHEGMRGTLHVQPAGTPYPHDQRFYDLQATTQRASALSQGAGLTANGLVAAVTSRSPSVTAGTGNPNEFIARFLPGEITIRTGQTVVWTNRDPATPHTVTFGTEPPGGPFGAFPPIPGPPGSATISSPSQSVNSGFLGAPFPFGTTFAVTFTAPGDYNYICALHDDLGMKGVVHVR